ncbi:hemerythrin domain-containing protein [Caballeronia sordidicola]|uniref:hemerythrin domain-containing protein n=1 Tax=Caballeronia sordidicola TaxID=196367 RepID=UPI00054E37A6|nr:hemerythrin domain-containing protein [Caballeronia sordidicola]
MDLGSFGASPRITTMIKLDHTHVLAAFHRYRTDAPQWRKAAIVNTICAALEIHAQLEEEIFYPALRAANPTATVLDKSVPEHDAMRESIAKLRSMDLDSTGYDATLMELMREVLHHVADEETILLPMAEDILAADLRRLGARMNTRRMHLVASRPAELAINTAGAFPVLTLSLAGAAAFTLVSVLRSRTRQGRNLS